MSLGVLHPSNSAVDEGHHTNDYRAGCNCEEKGVEHLSLPSTDLRLNLPHRNTKEETALLRSSSRLDDQVSSCCFHHSHHSLPHTQSIQHTDLAYRPMGMTSDPARALPLVAKSYISWTGKNNALDHIEANVI